MVGLTVLGSPANATRVDVSLVSDIRYWTRLLGVSETQLRNAVVRVGEVSRDVRIELHRKAQEEHASSILRIFVFYPSAVHRYWWVLLPGGRKETFAAEGPAVDFALARARLLRGSGRGIEVMQEKTTGTWMRVSS
jgi:hypothetical protein